MKILLLGLLRMAGRLWCRFHGVRMAPGVLVHGLPLIRIRRGGQIDLAAGATLNAACWANPLNDGRRTVLHAGPQAGIRIGRDAGISSSRLIAFSGIQLGEGTLVGAGCLLCDSDMHGIPLGPETPVATAPITIGQRVFIGAGTTILKGVTIGDGSVIGAGSVVVSSIPAGVLAAGNPARVIRPLH